MAILRYGDRIAKRGIIQPGCSAIVYHDAAQKVLLTQRTDNGRWCLPGGRLDPGESVEECCVREVLEETGLIVEVRKMVGVYSNPHMLVEYADNSVQILGLCFEVVVTGGVLRLSDETTAYGYFSLDEMENMDVMENHHERIVDAMAQQIQPFLR